MGKDKFGTKRGKCGLCEECYEYTPPEDGTSLACDYCEHKPIYHIVVVKLGTCVCEKCPEYTSRYECQYTSCDNCDCSPDKHLGYEKVQLEVEKAKQRLSQYDLKSNPGQPICILMPYITPPRYDTPPQMMYPQSAVYSSAYLRHSNLTQPLPELDQSELEARPRNYATQVLKFSFVGCISVIIAIKVVYEVFVYVFMQIF